MFSWILYVYIFSVIFRYDISSPRFLCSYGVEFFYDIECYKCMIPYLTLCSLLDYRSFVSALVQLCSICTSVNWCYEYLHKPHAKPICPMGRLESLLVLVICDHDVDWKSRLESFSYSLYDCSCKTLSSTEDKKIFIACPVIFIIWNC